jgi:hypothetical protein
MASAADRIAAYVRAKDENRPYLARDVFDEHASLTVVVKSDDIAFPAATRGRQGIIDVLVRDFGRRYQVESFSCRWLVGMSMKADGAVRAGWGRYDWTFDTEAWRVRQLVINIEAMQVLPARCLEPVAGWTFALPYPWCPPERALAAMPDVESLQGLRDYVRTPI